jgi:O-antigen/teichoic acid export membrane protein
MVAHATKSAVISRRVLQSTVANYVGKFTALGIGFLLTPFILHHVGTTGFGLWVLVGSIVGYGSLFDFGISGAVAKYVAEYRSKGEIENAHSVVATALSLYSILGLIAIILSVAVVPLLPHLFRVPPAEHMTVTWLALLMGSTVGIAIPCTAATAVLQGLQRFDLLNVITVAGALIYGATTVAVLLLGGGLIGLAAIRIPSMLILQVPAIWFIKRLAPELHFGWSGASRRLVRMVVSYSWSLFVLRVAGRFQLQSDEIVIGAFLRISAVTPYALALTLANTVNTLTDQFLSVLLPLASELHAENDQARLRGLYTTSTRLTLAILLPLGCTLCLLARPILTVWVGTAYAGYAYLVIILTLARLIDTSQYAAGSILQGIARQRPVAVVSLCVGVANLGLSIALVHPFGLVGVALGTLIPFALESICFVLPYSMRVIGVTSTEVLREIVLPAFLPAVPMAAVLYLLVQTVQPASLIPLVGVAGAGLIVYLIGYVGFGARGIERQTYHSMARSTIRFAKAHIK